MTLERDRPRRAAGARLDAVRHDARTEEPADGARKGLPPLALIVVRLAVEDLEPSRELDAGRRERGGEVDRPGREPSTGGEGEVERGDAVLADERGEEPREERVVVGCGGGGGQRRQLERGREENWDAPTAFCATSLPSSCQGPSRVKVKSDRTLPSGNGVSRSTSRYDSVGGGADGTARARALAAHSSKRAASGCASMVVGGEAVLLVALASLALVALSKVEAGLVGHWNISYSLATSVELSSGAAWLSSASKILISDGRRRSL